MWASRGSRDSDRQDYRRHSGNFYRTRGNITSFEVSLTRSFVQAGWQPASQELVVDRERQLQTSTIDKVSPQFRDLAGNSLWLSYAGAQENQQEDQWVESFP